MGQDFVARKAAKKQRKRSARDAETGRKKRRRKEDGFEVQGDDDGLTAEQVKRKRKKGNNVSLRISRALCYKPPQLTAEDLKWDGTEEGGDGGGNTFSFDDMAEAGYGSDVEEAMQKGGQPKQQKQPALKLSTAVNLLDPATAAKLAAKQQTKQQQPQAQQQQRSKEGQQQQLDEQVAAAPALKALLDAGLPAVIGRCMVKLGFTEPTPIQSACWGPAAAGRDVLGHAEPGSGKTLAYLLPAYAHILSKSSSTAAAQQQEENGAAAAAAAAVQPRVLVLLPSRELAQQVHGQCTVLFGVTGVSTAVVYGGVPKDEQIDLLQRRMPQLLVATPGRLLDLLDSNALSLDTTSLVVLDEADKMLSVGFEPQLQRLKVLLLDRQAAAAGGSTDPSSVKKKSKKQKRQEVVPEAAAAAGQQCQVLLFSATLPKAVRQTADGWLKAGYASVSCSADADAISNTITQVVQVCAEHKKPAKLLKHLAAVKAASEGQRNPPRMLVFANRIKTVIFVHRTLSEAGYRAVLLHGKRSQQERDAAVAEFKAGKAQVLVASDVASRGLDIRGLPYVVNYDFPSNLEVYIHRVGRTGRLAAAGHAFSFFTRPLAKLAAPLISLLNAHHQPIDPNLLLLSEAWARAEAALKAQGKSTAELEAAAAAADEGEEEGEDGGAADAAGLPEDLQEGLSQEQLAAQAAHAASQAAFKQQQEPKRSKRHAGDAVLVPTSRTAAAAADGAPTAAAAATAAEPFMPSAKFAGAKPGYVFQKGPRGVGYYLDPMQQKQLVQQQAKQQRKQEHQAVLQQALKQYKQQQQQGNGQGPVQQDRPKKGKAAAAGAASAAAGGSSKAAAAGGSSSKAAKAKESLPMLPGLAKKRKLPAFLSGGDLSDDDGAARVLDDGGSDSGSDREQGGAGFEPRSMQQRLQRTQLADGGSSKRRKALPGRLRKKLAKAAAGGKGSGDSSSSAKGKGKGRQVGK